MAKKKAAKPAAKKPAKPKQRKSKKKMDNQTKLPLPLKFNDRKMSIKIKDLKLDAGTQGRAALNEDKVKEYAEIGVENMPPIDVVLIDGTSDKVPVDGYTRIEAQRTKHGANSEISCRVAHGTMEQAELASFAANADHGQPRTNADKHKILKRILKNPAYKGLSDPIIAEIGKFSASFVRINRQADAEPTAHGARQAEPEKRTGKDGKKRTVAPKKKPAESKPAASTGEPAPATPATPAAGNAPDGPFKKFIDYNETCRRLTRELVNELEEHLGASKTSEKRLGHHFAARMNWDATIGALKHVERHLRENAPAEIAENKEGYKTVGDLEAAKAIKDANKAK